MRTEALISRLATDLAPVDQHFALRRLSAAVLTGVGGGSLLAVALYGVRPDLQSVLTEPLYWLKLAFPLSIAAGAAASVARIARPGAPIKRALFGIAAPVTFLWAGGAAMLLAAVPSARMALLLGHTWRSCVFNIALLSIPGFVALFRALRGLAPTRLRAAGALAGLLGGALATLTYCLHCPEMAMPFWALWYVLGMAVPTAVGTLAGPRWLRW